MLEALLAGLFGLLIGSFLNVCIHRMPRDESVVHPRSRCPRCEQPIAWYDNVPVLSWILLRGACRHCREAIPLRYPLVELLTGILFAAAILVYGLTPAGLRTCIFSAILVALIFTDLEERILPDEFTLGGTMAAIALAVAYPPPPGLITFSLPQETGWRLSAGIEAAASAAILSGVLWFVGAIYHRLRGREGLGFGDVKMVACIGAFLGLTSGILALTAGSVLGSLTGIAWILIAREDARTFELPFGSFLGVGALLVAFMPQSGGAL